MMVTSLPELIRYSSGNYQMMAELVSALGMIGLALTVVGLYGFLAFRVTQRRREIGIRMALGASREATSLLVLRDTAGMALIGLALGLLVAAAVARLESSLVFGVSPLDVLFAGRRSGHPRHCHRGRQLAACAPRRFHRPHAGLAHRVTDGEDDEFAASRYSLRTAPVAQVAGIHASPSCLPSPSASAPTPPSSRSSTRRCCACCPSKSQRNWCAWSGRGAFSGSMSAFGGDSPEHRNYFSYPMYKDLREQNQVFQGILASDKTSVGVSWHNQAESKDAEVVSGNYFQLLGLRPSLGRLFTTQDETEKNANPVTVLSYDYWRTRFGAAQDIVGRTILVNGHTFTVVGVAPDHFDSAIGGYKPGVFVPITMIEYVIPWRAPLDDLKNHQSAWLTMVARLKPGVSSDQAQASLGTSLAFAPHAGILAHPLEVGSASTRVSSITRISRSWMIRGASTPTAERSGKAAHHPLQHGRAAGGHVRHQRGHAAVAARFGAGSRDVHALCPGRTAQPHRVAAFRRRRACSAWPARSRGWPSRR